MPTPKPLTPAEAKASLAAKFGGTADRLRQLNTLFGVRPYRVFLVWTSWTGAERGEGYEKELHRVEILPTPKVTDLTAVALDPRSAGILPTGSIRVTEISTSYKRSMLEGQFTPKPGEPFPLNLSFFYEVMEDGRTDDNPERMKFRLSATPFLNAENVEWQMILERISKDRPPALPPGDSPDNLPALESPCSTGTGCNGACGGNCAGGSDD